MESTVVIDGHHVKFEPGKGWICDCTGVHVERIDSSLDCRHWPSCEHIVKAAVLHRGNPHTVEVETLDFVSGARAARGVAVIIDVFRAFSVACHAFARGARRIIPVASIESARALKRANPDFVLVGERHARKLEGFDYGNSPTEIERADLDGRTLVHTTHAGTRGLANATRADIVLTGSLVNAGAIIRYIRHLAPTRVSLVRMGHEARERTDEDDVCAELLEAGILGGSYDVGPIAERLRGAASARKFFDPDATWAPESDFALCTDVDRFDFVLRLERSGSHGAELHPLRQFGDRWLSTRGDSV